MSRRILGIGWRQHDDTDADFDAVDEIVALRAEVKRLSGLLEERRSADDAAMIGRILDRPLSLVEVRAIRSGHVPRGTAVGFLADLVETSIHLYAEVARLRELLDEGDA